MSIAKRIGIDHATVRQWYLTYQINKMILSRGTNLSGGQIQKTAILRARIRNPKISILDEVNSFLDIDSKLKLYK